MQKPAATTPEAKAQLLQALSPLRDVEITKLIIPVNVASQFEPSQYGTIVGTLVDALLPSIALDLNVGLTKGAGILGDREGYPDFHHDLGYRLELKGLFKDNPSLELKRPETPREPSARLTQKVTMKNVKPDDDFLLLLCYQLTLMSDENKNVVAKIIDFDLFPVIELIQARDARMFEAGGKWFGNYETPTIPSRIGKEKLSKGGRLDDSGYGRKESEGYDFNEDTNFGKMKRIPYQPLQRFLKKHGATYSRSGNYPSPWRL